ncbi:hypothetical protein NG895_09310 [Aeoliella sp. ICT_H6.2]|uniref:Uncharacterized protein n=1 Tax=Aeoliella straminimaris TaxID=2954799 RepID=A0A9X2FDY9_9BACT|nr:hypothetical protein [Aeoliella straminimaris]MCO6044106.1 hypothetical protein [Aeoliella straminimaris]
MHVAFACQLQRSLCRIGSGFTLFVPKGGGPSAKGEIQPDGAYQLKTEDGYHGAVLGSYYVAVMAFEEKGRYQPNYDSPDIPRGSAKDSGELVPAHYMDPTTSNITYEVESGNNDFTIRLSSKK